MQTIPHREALAAAQRALARAHSSLEQTEDYARHFTALCEVIDILSSDAYLVSALADIGKQLADHLAILGVPPREALESALTSLRVLTEEPCHV